LLIYFSASPVEPPRRALYDGLYAYLGREVLLPISLIPTI
jgi:hypothetical protein